MNALRAIVLLVACFAALRSALASSSIALPAPHDICSGVDITVPSWQNYDVVRLLGVANLMLLLLSSFFFFPAGHVE